MIYFACILLGLITGGLSVYCALKIAAAKAGAHVDLRAVRWERVEAFIHVPALEYIRRHHPAHDLVGNVRFLDLVQAKGKTSDDIVQRCGNWTVAAVMIDKRTSRITRVILWRQEESDAEEKNWILRRVGYRVSTIMQTDDEDAVLQAMAA